MKKLILIIALIFLSSWCPVCIYYQDYVYDKDRAIYEAEKVPYDSIQTIMISHLKDSLYSHWVTSHDTTIRTIKKITKTPTYDEYGYYRKTNKLGCTKGGGKYDMICEPMEEWVTTGYYIDGYTYDTIWTSGYTNRSEWINQATQYATSESQKQWVELPYTGHEFHYMLKYDSGWHAFGWLSTIFGICALVILVIRKLDQLSGRL